MNHSFILAVLNANAGFAQNFSIFLAIREQRIILGRDDDGGSQRGKICCSLRNCIRVFIMGIALQVLIPEPFHRLSCEPIAGGMFFIGDSVKVAIIAGIDKELEGKVNSIITRFERNR